MVEGGQGLLENNCLIDNEETTILIVCIILNISNCFLLLMVFYIMNLFELGARGRFL